MNPWFRCAEPRPNAGIRLICFPHSGGSAAIYRSWQEDLPSAIEVLSVQYPGRADRIAEAVVDDMTALVRLVVAEMAPLLDRPLALFGHSLGGMIAYEVARSLQTRGAAPVHLFVSACRAADIPSRDRWSRLDDDELVEALMRMGGTGADLLASAEMRSLILPYVRGDFRLFETYKHEPNPLLSVPIVSFVGDGDQLVMPEEAAGWGKLTSGAFEHRALPGDHFYLVPRQREILAEIAARLGFKA